MLAQLYIPVVGIDDEGIVRGAEEWDTQNCNATIVALQFYGDNEVRATGKEQHHDTRKHRSYFHHRR